MPLCKKYEELTPIQRVTMVGEIVHAMQSDDKLFGMCEEVIKMGLLKGVYEGITFLPQTTNEMKSDD